MRRYKTEWYESWFVWFLSCGLLFGILVFGTTAINAASCKEVGQMTGRETTYKFLSGCYVKVNNRMIPADTWRGEQDINEDD